MRGIADDDRRLEQIGIDATQCRQLQHRHLVRQVEQLLWFARP
jgi:hypothetical protein